MSGELDGMQEYMGGVRAYFERARMVRAFAERMSPAQFGARDRRLIAAQMGEAQATETLADYHIRLLEAETMHFPAEMVEGLSSGTLRVIPHPRALPMPAHPLEVPGSSGAIVQVRR